MFTSFSVLLKEVVTIKRPTSGEGYVDEEGNWITAVTTTDIDMAGSIQPYDSTVLADGMDTLPFKDGFNSHSTRTVYTDQLVYPVDPSSQREPDEMEFDGDVWVCYRVYNYLNCPLPKLRHCESVWIKREAILQ